MVGVPRVFRLPFFLLCLVPWLASCGVSPTARSLARFEPLVGVLLGVNLQTESTTLEQFEANLGKRVYSATVFVSYPVSESGFAPALALADSLASRKGILVLTVEPFGGLASVNDTDTTSLAGRIAAVQAKGVGVIVRFAHEMNGAWYPWGQKPALYRDVFRRTVSVVRATAPKTAFVWAPNHASGYPFIGPHAALPGSPDYLAMDTNGDGVVTQIDNPYEPFYPGDDVVDWVGMSLYHYGREFPFGENEVPLLRSFSDRLLGRNPETTNFYGNYCDAKGKPLMLAETSALYNTEVGGESEVNIKLPWLAQVFHLGDDDDNGINVAVNFPKLKMVNWFEHLKSEAEAAGDMVDWRVTANATVRAKFLELTTTPHQGAPYFRFAP